MAKSCSGWCLPTIIYLFLVVIGTILSLFSPIQNEVKISLAVKQLILGLVWTAFLYVLCYTCHEGWSWFILLLPFILGIIAFVLLSIFAIIQASNEKVMLIKNPEHMVYNDNN